MSPSAMTQFATLMITPTVCSARKFAAETAMLTLGTYSRMALSPPENVFCVNSASLSFTNDENGEQIKG
ncbi:peptide methionine sulfoxide reductase MsrB [Klebsiella grimontii]|uniref:Peptide methionine sulfoxide reductase MsrB n=1 Tax=Klebsiella grimontii TaxID=2058152 RepID=A0A7H4P5J4_9ENTR|nr:peptide methionine sulfoxide reductase MsrB [Klebsiella grimontii]